jgi:hypothetical protein
LRAPLQVCHDRRGGSIRIELQFHQASGAKIRPAVVVLDSGDEDFVAAPVTSRARAFEFDTCQQARKDRNMDEPDPRSVYGNIPSASSVLKKEQGREGPFDER